MASTDGVTALRGTIVTCRDDPFLTDPAKAFAVETDGIVICRNGLVEAVGPAGELLPLRAGRPASRTIRGCLIVPGFIDTHVHYVQTGMVASYGEQLLDWLDRYAFPAEMEFADPAHAAAMAQGLLRRAAAQRHHHARWCSARSIRNRSTRCSPKPNGAACASSPARC